MNIDEYIYMIVALVVIAAILYCGYWGFTRLRSLYMYGSLNPIFREKD